MASSMLSAEMPIIILSPASRRASANMHITLPKMNAIRPYCQGHIQSIIDDQGNLVVMEERLQAAGFSV